PSSRARIRGAATGMIRATVSNQSASCRLRDVGACQSAATRSLAKARLTTKTRPLVSTLKISEDTPPASGVSTGHTSREIRPKPRRAPMSSSQSTSLQGEAAVDHVDGSSGVGAFVGGQIHAEQSDFLSLSDASHGLPRGKLFADHLYG